MAESDPMRFHDELLQKLDEDYIRVHGWLEKCASWESRVLSGGSIVDIVLHGPASIPAYKKQLRNLENQRRHLWRREAALLAAGMGMDDTFVSDLTDEELRHIQEHKEPANLRHTLVAVQQRVVARQLRALRDRCRGVLRSINEYIGAVSSQEDSEDRLFNLHQQRRRVVEKLTEVEQTLARLQGEDGEPELPG